MIKAAFFDIDGTLLSHNTNTVSESSRLALRQLREKGILVFLASGRQHTVLQQLESMKGIEVDGIISLNGQYCCCNDGFVYECPVHEEDIHTVLDFLEGTGHACMFIDRFGMFVNRHNPRLEEVQASIHTPLPLIDDLRRGLRNPIYQMILYMTDEEAAGLPPMKHCKKTRWHNGAFDLIPASGGKAAGIREVLKHYGIDPKDTISFGDAQNDLDMLQSTGISVAMGNAADNVKALATYVTTDVDHDGVYNALVHFGIL